jgi:hypothetical protein
MRYECLQVLMWCFWFLRCRVGSRMLTIRFLILFALFGAVMYGDDITLPLDDGNILIHAQFIRRNEFGSYLPELAYTIRNQTSSPWRTLKLQFDVGGLCNGEPRQWTVPVLTSLGWAEDHQLVREYKDTVIPLVGKVDGCTAEIIKARLLLAESFKVRIDGVAGERVDLEKELQKLKVKREAEAAAQAEEERKAAEAQAKEDTAEQARRKRRAATRKRKEAEDNALLARYRADAEAKAAAEQARLRAACAVIYRDTAKKKVSDLTVDEEQKVRACQALRMYPPR